VKDPDTGEVIEVHCTYDPESRGGSSPDGRKVKGTLHWVSIPHALDAEVRLYDRLFTHEDPSGGREGKEFHEYLNPDSLKVISAVKVERSLGDVKPGQRMQFERQGYFCVDPESQPGKLIFNRTVTLRDSWAKHDKKK